MKTNTIMINMAALLALFLLASGSTSFADNRIIAQAEYFIDIDPGVGNGLPLAAGDGVFDEANEVMLVEGVESASLSLGEHILYVRARDDDGTWGVARQVRFMVIEASPYKKLVAAEYFIGDDPGPGNGVPLRCTDGAFDESLEAVIEDEIATDMLCAGIYTVGVRFRDNQSHWTASGGFNGWGPVQIATLSVSGVPCAPEDFSAQPDCEKMTLSWTASYSATSYEVYRDGEKIGETGETNFKDSLVGGIEHCYYVKAKNGYGTGASSDSICLAALPRPLAVQPKYPSNHAADRPTTIDFCWDTTGTYNVVMYHLQVNRDSTFISAMYFDDSLAGECRTVSDLGMGRKYFWRVRARNDCGWGPWSEIRDFATQLFSISGQVYDTCGHSDWREPVAGARVLLKYDSLDTQFFRDTITDESGIYVFDKLFDTSYCIYYDCDDPDSLYLIYYLESCSENLTEKNISICQVPTGVRTVNTPLLPTKFALSQNYPNPFNPMTTIEFALPRAAFVDIAVYNVLGERIRTLASEYLTAGYKAVIWDGRDEWGRDVATGIYLYRIRAADFVESKKMLLLK